MCLLIYGASAAFCVSAWVMRDTPAGAVAFLFGAVLITVLAAAFHYLAVNDESDRLMIRFGPVPLFRRAVLYDDIVSVEPGRTTLLDGWGIHYSLRGGWVWNLWGFDCVVIHMRSGKMYLGSDEAEELCTFLQQRIEHRPDSQT